MGWIQDLLTSSSGTPESSTVPDRASGERFPRDTYGPGYPLTISQDELDDINRLLDEERQAPDGWEEFPLLSRAEFNEIVSESTGESLLDPEERRGEIRQILKLWEDQLVTNPDSVWITIGTDYRFRLYIHRCETRADADHDQFEEPPELDTAREVLSRIETVQNTDSKLAVVHHDDLPLEEAEVAQEE